MKTIENKNIIYKAVNKTNGKIYIGATTHSLEERKKDHIQKALNGKGSAFQEALASYSTDNFIWEEIDTANTINELAEKEKRYIQLYDSNHMGYNSDEGGGFKKNVYQYTYSGDLIAVYDCLTDIENQLHIDKRRISSACNHSTLCKGSFWSYKLNDVFKMPVDDRKRIVKQFDLQGNFIAEYDSVSNASKINNISKTCISRCCRGERENSKGYIWKYD